VFNSGVLAGGDTFDYARASEDVLARAREIAAACERHGVPVTAAAMRFPLRHAAVRAVIVGARSPQEIRANAEAFRAEIPDELWLTLARGRS
jgi:D-threo-aldose 1-dehydrogenase